MASGVASGGGRAQRTTAASGGAPMLGSTLQSWPRAVTGARAERVRSGGVPAVKRRKPGPDVLEWARRVGVLPQAEAPVSAADVLAARARAR